MPGTEKRVSTTGTEITRSREMESENSAHNFDGHEKEGVN